MRGGVVVALALWMAMMAVSLVKLAGEIERLTARVVQLELRR